MKRPQLWRETVLASGAARRQKLRKYNVQLSPEEREELLSLTRKGKAGARTLKRAMVLLAADEGERHRAIAAKLRLHGDTVADISRRFLEGGLRLALHERPRPGKARVLGPREEATLVALTCSNPPDGRAHWTMQLLADRLVALKVVDSISDETVRRTLKRGTQALAV